MIRIVHVITDLDKGGAEAMLSKLVVGMDRNRFENQVVSLTDFGTFGRSFKEQGILVHSLGMTLGHVSFSAVPRLIRILRKTRPTIVQSWLYHADLLALLSLPFSGFPKLVWNIRCSDMDMSKYSFITRAIRRCLVFCSGLPSAVVVNSEAGKKLHQQLGYHVRRWESIPNGFDLNRFAPNPALRKSMRAELNISEHAVIVGLIARVDPMKDHETFFKAAQIVAETNPDVYFLCVGKDTESLVPLARKYGLGKKMFLMGLWHNIENILPGFDICCLTSAFGEGFPNVLGEAMACSIPCITTDVGDSGLIVGDTGLVVPARDVSALAGALLDLIRLGSEARNALGVAAQNKVEREYALDKIIQQYEQFYSSLNH